MRRNNNININDKKRTFIAINLEREIKEYIYNLQQEINQIVNSCEMKVKFVEKDNLHISLKFLGDLNSVEIEKTSATLQNISQKYYTFTVSLSKNIGIFPTLTRPRVIWIGIEKGSDIIFQIYQSIEKRLKSEPFYQKEKQFTAHITLARIKYLKYPQKLCDYLKDININPITDFIKKIDLIESQLTKEGPLYKVTKSFPLSLQTLA